MRAREPDRSGFVDRDGVKVGWELFDRDLPAGAPTVFLLPTWAIVHSRFWKGQVPDLARRYRVLTMDNRGNGRSDRPAEPEQMTLAQTIADCVAVMDASGTAAAVIVGLSMGGAYGLRLAALHPDRVLGAILVGPAVGGFGHDFPEREEHDFDAELPSDEGWAKYNRHYWQRDWPGFATWFFGQIFSEPHSTKQIEDGAGWTLETTPETILAIEDANGLPGSGLGTSPDLAAMVRCPVLIVHGTDDRIIEPSVGRELAAAMGAELLELEGAGHNPLARDPVRMNLVIRDFVGRVTGAPAAPTPRTWTRARARPKRALYISSPIGLGHAQRDVAIARELRQLQPDLQIDWLAQDPVTRVLEKAGERLHPASALLASESRHIESESAEHDLHVFQTWRRMDEIMVANFMVFHDVAREGGYDLWIGDEAWEVDYFLHENPELKTAPYAWLTDFVGWLPMPEAGPSEAVLTADYNAEMIEQIARFPRIRDRALFVGEPPDVVPDRFGPELPAIRDWTAAHYDFPGYVLPFGPDAFVDREAIRTELGYGRDERVAIATVGGTSVGTALLRRIVAAYPAAKRAAPDLRMIVVCGPRIDPAEIPAADGLEVRRYVHDLYRHLAVADLAIVQGGLSTTMELTANGVPFLYIPLRRHFEQQFHVRHRLDRHGAGRHMTYDEAADPDALAAAIVAELGRPTAYHSIPPGGADRAAASLAELLG
jgi:pimeloyl-ACP methyl ester carboxylesterase